MKDRHTPPSLRDTSPNLGEELYKNSPSKQLGALQSNATKVPCLRRGIRGWVRFAITAIGRIILKSE